jgi:hypothetical protein
MLWKLMQFCIVVGIIGSNNKYGWAPTGLSAGIVAVFAAFVATGIISELLRLVRWLLGTLKRFNHQESSGIGIGGECASHQLIGEQVLHGSGHDDPTGSSLGQPEQRRIENMKSVHPLRRP